jgi:hypothetical protein
MVLHYFLGWDRYPLIVEPGVPTVLWIPFVSYLHLELCLHSVCDTAAEQRLGIDGSVRVLVVIRPL